MVVPRDHRGRPGEGATKRTARPPMQMGPVPAPRDPGMGGRVLLGPMPAPGAQGGTGTGAGRPLPHVRRTRVQARPGTRARLLLRPVPQQVEPAHPHRDKCPPTAIMPRMRRTARYRHARRILRRRRKAHDYKTARDRRIAALRRQRRTIERLRNERRRPADEGARHRTDTETIRRHGIETRARTHILAHAHAHARRRPRPRSLTAGTRRPDRPHHRRMRPTGEDGDAERLLRRHGPRGAAGKRRGPRMAISMTKLSSADYYLDRTREALQADGAIPDEATPDRSQAPTQLPTTTPPKATRPAGGSDRPAGCSAARPTAGRRRDRAHAHQRTPKPRNRPQPRPGRHTGRQRRAAAHRRIRPDQTVPKKREHPLGRRTPRGCSRFWARSGSESYPAMGGCPSLSAMPGAAMPARDSAFMMKRRARLSALHLPSALAAGLLRHNDSGIVAQTLESRPVCRRQLRRHGAVGCAA